MRRESRSLRRWVLIAAVTLVVVVTAPLSIQMVFGSQQGYVTVDGARPLAEALRALERRHGLPVTYEDPRYEHFSDIEEVTTIVRRDGNLSKKVLVPKGRPFTFIYDVPPDGAPIDYRVLLEKLLADYRNSDNPGLFSLTQSTSTFHVVPVGVRARTGNFIEQQSVLATRVSLPNAQRTVDQTIDAVLKAIKTTAGFNVGTECVHTRCSRQSATWMAQIMRPLPML